MVNSRFIGHTEMRNHPTLPWPLYSKGSDPRSRDSLDTCTRSLVVTFCEVVPPLERLRYSGPLRVIIAFYQASCTPDGRTALGAQHAPPWPRDRWRGAQGAERANWSAALS